MNRGAEDSQAAPQQQQRQSMLLEPALARPPTFSHVPFFARKFGLRQNSASPPPQQLLLSRHSSFSTAHL